MSSVGSLEGSVLRTVESTLAAHGEILALGKQKCKVFLAGGPRVGGGRAGKAARVRTVLVQDACSLSEVRGAACADGQVGVHVCLVSSVEPGGPPALGGENGWEVPSEAAGHQSKFSGEAGVPEVVGGG